MKPGCLTRLLPLVALLALLPQPVVAQLIVGWTFPVDRQVPDYSGPESVGLANAQAITLSAGSALIQDLQISLNIAGRSGDGFNGDLYAQLGHRAPDGSAAGFAVLLNRPGLGPDYPLGYPDNGLDMTLSSSATHSIQSYRDAPSFSDPSSRNASGQVLGQWQPAASLASFWGVPNGEWNLYVEDRSAGAMHQLASWGLDACVWIGDTAALTFGNQRVRAAEAAPAYQNAINLVGGSGPTVIDGLLGLEFAGVVQGNGGFLKQGAGTFRLSNANSFSGGLEIRQGRLEAGHSEALGSGEVNLAGGVLASGSGLSLAVANSVRVTADSKVEAPDRARLELSGALSGSRLLEKTGLGTLALSQNSPGFAGTFRVSGGTLAVSANLSAAQVDHRQGATLAGSGTVGNTTVAGAFLAPGASVGLITISGDLALGNVVDPDTGQPFEATYLWEINNPSGTAGADPGWDFVHVTGRLTIGDSITALSPFNVQATPLAAFSVCTPRQWTILTADQGFRNPDDSTFQPDLSKFRLDGSGFSAFGTVALSLSGDGRSLNVDFVPEPAQSAAMLAALLTAFALGRGGLRRRLTKDC